MNTLTRSSESVAALDPTALRWARDVALLGIVTATCTPLVGNTWVPLELGRYAGVAGALGLVGGAVAGGVWSASSTRFPARSRLALALVVGPVLFGALGGFAAGGAAVLEQPRYTLLALPCGTIAGTLQGTWFLPAAQWLGDRGLPRWPLALLSGLVSPVLAAAGVIGVMMVIELVFR